MTIDNWINLIAAILVGCGTLFLGIMAWRTILQTRSIQKEERRQRLLNDIIEWAIDVSKCDLISDFSKYAEIKDETEYNIITGMDSMGRLINLENQGEYIKQIALRLEQGLGNAVGEVITNIKEREGLLAKSMGSKPVEVGRDIQTLFKKTV